MMPDYGDAQFPYPNSSDIPDGPGAFLALLQRMELMLGSGIAKVADLTARAALVSNGDAYDGLIVWQISDDTLWYYDGSSWHSMMTLKHEEFTATSASVLTNTISSVGTLTRDGTRSNITGLATIAGNVLTIAADGIYSLDFLGSLNGAVSGNTFAWATDSAVALSPFKVNGTTSSTTFGGAMISAHYIAAGTTLTMQFLHNSAANRILTSRFMLTRVGVL